MTDQTASLRDRIRQAVCEAEGFAWDDMLEPDEYGEVADAVIAVLPTFVLRSDEQPPTDRDDVRDRIADALAAADGWTWVDGFDKTKSPSYQRYLAQADALLTALPDVAALPENAGRAAVLREAITRISDPAERTAARVGLGLGYESALGVLERMLAETPADPAAADERAMQVLSNEGAQCGDWGRCGDQPGDRTCPDCERCRRRYVTALRAAGWGPLGGEAR
ncbi:hypothetical protein H3146_05865 [Streptomyces sp. OF3]|uniref:Uncharacterized protein n=1 Tax=Streptomyces alkaliterrae TaxID=2213162 RepID=A0A7W3WIF4_9ACTN|nr:hypothetical protein [Streptomyces alkaliterrae]MBB1252893.1 hypothetical protein [Streptomyces alkaliterrae]